jgi:hypothetical protein
MEGGGLMLWIMVGPGKGNRATKERQQVTDITIQEIFHGKDHPGNQ